jgi:choline dehydrogenase
LHSISLRDNGEVILAAGALATPAILQASGVETPSLLRSLGIKVQVDLPGVGENPQHRPDLTFSHVARNRTQGAITPYAAFVTAKDVFWEKAESIASYIFHISIGLCASFFFGQG